MTQSVQAATTGYPAMRDSIYPDNIPADTVKVAGYVDGDYAWPDHAWQRFTGQKVRITVEPWSPNGGRDWPNGRWRDAAVMDVEKGAFTPLAASRFIPRRNAFRPGTATIYTGEAGLGQLLSACRGHHYWLWLAWWIDREPTPADVNPIVTRLRPYGVQLAAWQWRSGQAYDVSAVLASHWLTAS